MSNYPPKLKDGDKVAIVSLGSDISKFPRRLKRGVKKLKQLGLQPVIFPSCNLDTESFSLSVVNDLRVRDLHEAFQNSDIKGIINASGGICSNYILDDIDFSLIASSPKVFCGFSDITILNNAIFSKVGLVTFNGPTVLSSFADYEGVSILTETSFVSMIISNQSPTNLEFSKKYTDKSLFWDREDNKPLVYRNSQKPMVVQQGKSEGYLIGGHLRSFMCLLGTSYSPSTQGAILLLEEHALSFYEFMQQIYHLEQLNVLKSLNGVLVSKIAQSNWQVTDEAVVVELREFFSKYNYPVIVGGDWGHTKPIHTVPIGGNVEISGIEDQVIIRVV